MLVSRLISASIKREAQRTVTQGNPLSQAVAVSKGKLFVGMTAAESQPLIHYLTEHAVRPQNVYRHQWQKDDLVMWDNRCLLHEALGDFDRTKLRHMERTTVHGNLSGYAYEGPAE